MRFCRKRPALFKSAQWHFHQDNAPVHNSILVTDYLTKMGINTVPHPPYSPDLAPCNFCLFPTLLLRDNWGDERGCWWKSLTRSHKRTSMGPSRSCWNGTSALQPEITSKGTRVSCVYFQLKCPYEKSLEIYLMILIYIYNIYIYTTHTHTHTYMYVCTWICAWKVFKITLFINTEQWTMNETLIFFEIVLLAFTLLISASFSSLVEIFLFRMAWSCT